MRISGENESVTTSFGIVAAAKEWKSNSANPWDTAGQWTPSGVPGATDNAVVDTSGGHSFILSVTHSNDVAHSLVVNSSVATVEIVNGGVLTLSGNLTIDAGTLQIDSGGLLKFNAASSLITGSFIDKGTVEVAAGDKLEIVSSVSGDGVFKIDAGATLQLDNSIGTKSVIFSGSGTLVLEDPAHFNGTVSDSNGSMTTGDVLDLIGFDTNAHVSYSPNSVFNPSSGGTVTVTESGHGTATIKVGQNSTHWSAPITDGHGGILIHDPPDDEGSADGQSVATNDHGGVNIVDPPAPVEQLGPMIMHDPGLATSQTIAATAPDRTLAGSATSDNFVFNFKAVGGAIFSDFQPGADSLQFGQSIFANAQAAFDALHDDGHGNTIIGIDAHDTISLGGVLKAQLHVGDFHVV